MPTPLLPLLLLLLSSTGDGVEVAQLTIRRSVVIRVPIAPGPPVPMPTIRWREKHGPRCLAIDDMAGAAITGEDSIDLVVRGGARFRAKLEDDCASAAFYDGFYLRNTPDGRVCAKRDVFHSRAGGQCAITGFRALVPGR